MSSLILRTATRLLKPLMLFFSVFVLLRGHNEPGGGFAGGLWRRRPLRSIPSPLTCPRRVLRYELTRTILSERDCCWLPSAAAFPSCKDGPL